MNPNDQLSKAPRGPLAPGTRAPDFTLHDTPDQRVSLSELRGRPVILVFYPADWSPVCGDELALFNDELFKPPVTVILAKGDRMAILPEPKDGELADETVLTAIWLVAPAELNNSDPEPQAGS